jgi:hypothetical protein
MQYLLKRFRPLAKPLLGRAAVKAMELQLQ